MNIRKYLKLLLFISLFIGLYIPAYSQETSPALIFVKEKLIDLQYKPIQKNDRTFITLYDVAKPLNLELSFDNNASLVYVSTPTTIFTYNTVNGYCTLNAMPMTLETSPFVYNGRTYMSVDILASLFDFNLYTSYDVFKSVYRGKESLKLDYLEKPLYIDIYDEENIPTFFFTPYISADTFSSSTFTAMIHTLDETEGGLTLAFTPYTSVPCPKEYTVMDSADILCASSLTLNLELSQELPYTYLTYVPTTSSTAITYDLSTLKKHIATKELYLAQLTTIDAKVTSVKQIYRP